MEQRNIFTSTYSKTDTFGTIFCASLERCMSYRVSINLSCIVEKGGTTLHKKPKFLSSLRMRMQGAKGNAWSEGDNREWDWKETWKNLDSWLCIRVIDLFELPASSSHGQFLLVKFWRQLWRHLLCHILTKYRLSLPLRMKILVKDNIQIFPSALGWLQAARLSSLHFHFYL